MNLGGLVGVGIVLIISGIVLMMAIREYASTYRPIVKELRQARKDLAAEIERYHEVRRFYTGRQSEP